MRWRNVPGWPSFFNDVRDTVRYGRRQQDPLNPQKYKYYRPCPDLEPEYNHIVAIVLFKVKMGDAGQIIANNYVVNVWAVYIYGKR